MAWSILISPVPGDRLVSDMDSLITKLWEQGTTGIVEETDGLRAFFDDDVQPSQLGSIRGDIRSEPPISPALDSEDCDAILIGQRFVLAPSGAKLPPDSGRFQLRIDAATAFGTGRHETTQLCIEALEEYLVPGACVVDIGCGSGILAAAAGLLGAAAVFSCDIHNDALETARKHLQTPLFFGSADAIRPGVADLVLANISAKVLDHIAIDLKRILKPSGLLILSGFIKENPARRFTPLAETARGGWLCWVCDPQAIDSEGNGSDANIHAKDWWL